MTDVEEFLRALLEPAPAESQVWCTQFEVPPGTAESRHWAGAACTADGLPPVNSGNAYYSVAVFPPEAAARDAKHMAGVAAVLLDDVTTKGNPAEVRRLLGEPSFRIATSRASEQWGYFLATLATQAQIKPVHDALKRMGLVDKSGAGPVRYGRLPAGINNKPEYGVPFAVRCVEWAPERRFTVESIAEKL